MKHFYLVGLIFISFSFGCQQEATQPDTKEVFNEIQERWKGFIENWEAENAKGCAEYYTESGINIPPSFKANEGKKEIEEFYNFLFDNNLSSDYNHNINRLDYMGDQALEMGEFEVHWTRNDSTEWTYYARTMTHWIKDDEGNWKIDKFLFNNPPAEE